MLKEVGSKAHRETPMSGSGWSHLPQFSSDEFVTSSVGGEAQEVWAVMLCTVALIRFPHRS